MYNNEDNDVVRLNAELDLVFSKKVSNKIVIYNILAATLEKYGIRFPITDLQDEQYVFEIGDSGFYLFVKKQIDSRGNFDVYAQVVDEDELEELEDSDMDISTEPVDPYLYGSRFLRQTRRTEDDGGNTSEY